MARWGGLGAEPGLSTMVHGVRFPSPPPYPRDNQFLYLDRNFSRAIIQIRLIILDTALSSNQHKRPIAGSFVFFSDPHCATLLFFCDCLTIRLLAQANWFPAFARMTYEVQKFPASCTLQTIH